MKRTAVADQGLAESGNQNNYLLHNRYRVGSGEDTANIIQQLGTHTSCTVGAGVRQILSMAERASVVGNDGDIQRHGSNSALPENFVIRLRVLMRRLRRLRLSISSEGSKPTPRPQSAQGEAWLADCPNHTTTPAKRPVKRQIHRFPFAANCIIRSCSQ